MQAFTAKMAIMAAMSVIPQIMVMSTIMSDELMEYSIHRP